MLFKNAAVNKLEELDYDALSYLSGVKVSKIVQFEMAFDGIIKNAKKHNVDLVVMGSHGASGFQEMFVGSNTEKVVRNSDVPVLVIKKEEEDFKAR
jgi:nucleotide-binding universal stress UspA family protein